MSLGGGSTETETVGKDVWLGSEDTVQSGVENLGKHVIIESFNVNLTFLS